MKKTLSILMALAMLCTLFAALPASAQEQKTLTLAWSQYDAITAFGPWEETPFIKEWEKQTGVEVKVIHPNDFSVYLASGQYADIVYYTWARYPGSASKAIEDGIIVPIEDKLEQYAPDYYSVLHSNPEWLKQATTPDGHIYGFNFIRGDRQLQTSAGIIVRTDWLEELGMEMPETADELYDVLVAFRDKKGATAPMTAVWQFMTTRGLDQGIFTSAAGLVRGSYYQVDGKVHYGYAEENYKGVLEYLHKLYEENLFDHNFLTIDDATMKSNMLNGISGVTVGFAGSGIGNILSAARSAGNETFELGGAPTLVANKGDRPLSGQFDNALQTGRAAAITTSCEDVETAMKFLNWCYTDEGCMMMNYGIEGETYTVEDGKVVYTELITNNPDGKNVQQALAQYSLGWCEGPFVQKLSSYQAWEEQKQAIAAWSANDAEKYIIADIAVPTELSDEYSAISSEVSTFVQEQTVAFITGERSLDEFDSYLETLKELNVERMIEIYQIALDEFNAR